MQGTRLALMSKRQMARAMLDAANASAIGLAANFVNLGETGDQDRLAQSDLLEPTRKHPSNVSGVSVNAHGGSNLVIPDIYQKRRDSVKCEKTGEVDSRRLAQRYCGQLVCDKKNVRGNSIPHCWSDLPSHVGWNRMRD